VTAQRPTNPRRQSVPGRSSGRGERSSKSACYQRLIMLQPYPHSINACSIAAT
jgi:hypothetical protein